QSKETNGPDLFPHLFPQPALAMTGERVLTQGTGDLEKIPTILAMDAPADGRGGRSGRKKGLKKTDSEDYRAATEDLTLSAEKDTVDASTLQILRKTTFINFKKVLISHARDHLGTVISLTRLAGRGHRWAFEVLSEAAKGGEYAANALRGMATRGVSAALDA